MRPVAAFAGALSLALVIAAAPGIAADDEDALSIADKATMTAEQGGDWKIFTEGALRESTRRSNGSALHGERLSFDVRYDTAIAPGLRAVFADRLDMNRLYGAAGDGNINTLKEAYLSWQIGRAHV